MKLASHHHQAITVFTEKLEIERKRKMLYTGLILAIGLAAVDAAPAAPCNSEDADSYGGAINTYDGLYLPPIVTIPVDGTETIDPEDSQTTDVAEATTPPVIDDPTVTTPGEEIIITIPIDQSPVPTPDTPETVTVPSDGEFTPEPTPDETPNFTPEPTPEIIPDFTPEPTPEPNPEPTPGSTPVPAPEVVLELACNSDLDQCYDTMEIYCNYIVIGTPGIFGVFTAQECLERCYNDPTCLLWTHIGTSCYVSSDPANNFVEDSWEGWTSGIRGRC